MKKNDLIRVIREIVRIELKKELPNALAQVFAQMMGQAQRPEIHSINMVRPVPKSEPPVPQPEDPVDEMTSLKSQLQEMFSGGAPVQRTVPQQQAVPQQKKFTSNPVLNEILNQTRPFNGSERMANRVGGAVAAAMSPGVAMAAGAYAAPSAAATGAGQMMESSELSFLNKIPGMPGADSPVLAELPTGRAAMLREGQEGGPAPLESLGTLSALDLKNHPALPDSIKGILTRDYRSLVRAMDKGKKK